ncbi:hypothetical protein BH23CHL5_BH23CHL5_18350 [soil metagenome]
MDNVLGIFTGVSLGLTFAIVGLPFWQAKVRPNRWYGFRTRATLLDTKTWYDVNQVTGRLMTLAGVLLAALGLFGLTARNDLHQQRYLMATCLLTATLWLAYAGIQGYRKSQASAIQELPGSPR